MRFHKTLLDLVVPPICLVCTADPAEEDPFLCPECLAELWRPGPRFLACEEIPFVTWMAFLGPFSGAIRTAVHEMKFGGRRRFARHLGGLLARRLPHGVPEAEILLPVPLSAASLSKRGFDQAEEIARGLGQGLGRVVRADLLLRRASSAPQRSLPLALRAANVRGAFGLSAGASSVLRGRSVGLVDDVMTTGATLAAAARLVRLAGAREVIAYVLGRRALTPFRLREGRSWRMLGDGLVKLRLFAHSFLSAGQTNCSSDPSRPFNGGNLSSFI